MKNATWFIIAALALLMAFLVHSPYIAYSIYAFLLLVTLAYFSSIAWLAGLDCTRELSQEIVRQGDSVQVKMTVHNKRGWPIPWIFLEDHFPKQCSCRGENTQLAVLMPGQSITIKYTLTFPNRGYHRIGPLVMESGDLFGLQRRFRTGEQQDYVSVLPTVAYIDTFNVASRRPQGPVRSTNSIFEDPSLLNGVREYMQGDPLNRIHWKSSARTGELFTKIFDPTAVHGATLILDLHGDSYVPERAQIRQELAITTTSSIAYLLQMSGEQVGMITNGLDAAEEAQWRVQSKQTLDKALVDDAIVGESHSDRLRPLQVPTLKSPVQAQMIIENLARIIPGRGLDAAQLILEEFRGLPRDATLLPVVPYMNENLAATLGEMKLNGFSVTVFYIDDNNGYEDAAALLAQHNIHTFHITDQQDLHGISPQKI
jgi:hypothetical protein